MKNRKELFYESIAKEFHTKKDRLNYFLDLKYDSPYQSLLEIKADVKKYMNNGIPDSLHGKLSSIFFDLDEPYDDTLTAGRDVYDYIEKILEKAPSNTQFGPEGNYRESLIRSYLKEILPQPSAIGTGFIVNEHNLSSKQIDIIIYDPRIAPLFKLDELVVVVPEAVYGIIEVKTTHRKSNYSEELNNANSNGKLVTIPLSKYIAEKENKIFEENRGYLEKKIEDYFFNGIFYYSLLNDINTKNRYVLANETRDKYLWDAEGFPYVNHIALSSGIFGRRFGKEFSFYDMKKKDLAFSYFFSNLIRIIMNRNNVSSTAISNHIFPIDDPNGKESLKIDKPSDSNQNIEKLSCLEKTFTTKY